MYISDFALSQFSRPRSLQTEEKWEDPLKTGEFIGSAEEWHHVSDGKGEREARPSLLHSLSRSVQRIQPRPSIQPIIKFIFSPHCVGFLEIWDMRQRETPCVFLISKQNKKNWDFHTWNQDTSRSRFVLKNRDIRIKSG